MTGNTETALAPLDETYNIVIAEIEQTHPLAERQVRFTRQGLLLPPDLSYDDCVVLTGYIAGRIRRDAVDANLMHLCLGQAINYSESRWGDTYTQWLDATGLSYGTLANAAYVARSVSPSLWNEHLASTHYTAVAPLPPDEQEEWLQTAVAEELGANELRRRIQASQDINAGRDPEQAAIERRLQRIAAKMQDTVDANHWAAVISNGLLKPLAHHNNAGGNTDLEWMNIVESLAEWQWDNPIVGIEQE